MDSASIIIYLLLGRFGFEKFSLRNWIHKLDLSGGKAVPGMLGQ